MPNRFDPQRQELVVVGNPESRRTQAFLAAARALPQFAIRLVSYVELFDRPGEVVPPDAGALVRIESPGESAAVSNRLLAAGCAEAVRCGVAPHDPIECLPKGEESEWKRGRIPPPLQWYLGFRAFLGRLDAAWTPLGVRWCSSPEAIAVMFDKQACLERWDAAGIATPPRYPSVRSYDELRAAVDRRHARLFVKLRYGYSAAGAVALEWRGDLVRAITTVEYEAGGDRSAMYVTKRPRVLRDEAEIARLIDDLAAERIVVEAWLPKARCDAVPFDLRLVVVGGKLRHVVGRAHPSPFTNLNLGARRLTADDVRRALGDDHAQLATFTERAAASFPDAAMIGIDVLPRASGRGLVALEANAFGDYLPGLLHEGLTTHETQLRWLANAA